MYRIVLIDDEPIITKGLTLLIERSGLPCRVVGIAHDGEEGMKIIGQLVPDIIVTDISMPKTDGLKMIEQLQKAKHPYQLIILSGFLEFEYAKRAMEFGVKHYLTKPVEEEELYAAIKDSILEIEARQERIENLKALENSFTENQANIKNYLLRDLLFLAEDAQDFMDYFLPADLFPSDSVDYVVILFAFSEKNGNEFVEDYTLFQSLLKKHLMAYQSVSTILYENHKIVVVIAHNDTIQPNELLESIQSVRKRVSKEWGAAVTAGIGQSYQSISDISTSFRNATYALEFQIIRGTDSVIRFEETMALGGFPTDGLPNEVILLQKHMFQGSDKEALLDIDRIFEILSSHPDVRPEDLQLQSLSILLFSIQNLSASQFQLNEFLGRDVFSLKTLSKFQTIEELQNWLKNTVRTIITLQAENKIPEEKDIIAEISEYLDDNYSGEISLHLLAEQFYINPYYLSQLFKDKTGESYLNYLTNLRIDKAKELLELTDKKIYEISLLVGYSDTSYFSRLFERNVGEKPSQYRKDRKKKG